MTTGRVRAVAVWLLLLLLALALGVWTWWAGYLKLPPLSALRLEAARASGPAVPWPSRPGPPPADVTAPAQASPRPSRAATAPVPAASRQPGYAVQLHAFRSEAEADRVIARYRSEGLPAVRAEGPLTDGGRWWRVLVGGFETRHQAEAFGRDLVGEGKVQEFVVADGARTR